jgi:hypothetical protein
MALIPKLIQYIPFILFGAALCGVWLLFILLMFGGPKKVISSDLKVANTL